MLQHAVALGEHEDFCRMTTAFASTAGSKLQKISQQGANLVYLEVSSTHHIQEEENGPKPEFDGMPDLTCKYGRPVTSPLLLWKMTILGFTGSRAQFHLSRGSIR